MDELGWLRMMQPMFLQGAALIGLVLAVAAVARHLGRHDVKMPAVLAVALIVAVTVARIAAMTLHNTAPRADVPGASGVHDQMKSPRKE